MNRNCIRSLLLALALLASPLHAQTAQGTAFTYQGLLSQGGTPVSGNVDAVFALFDAPTSGAAIGPTLTFTAANGNALATVNGVFDATLDFGTLAFNGVTSDQRFLEIRINGAALTPRTPIQNAPYALQSRTAELAYTVSNGSIGAGQINTAQVQRRVSGACASGSSIQLINSDGTVACQSAGNGTITGVTAGNGLSGGGTAGAVALTADTNFVQKRVTGTCASGSAVQTIAADGSVTCQTGGSGTINSVTAGRGLAGGGSSGSVTIGIGDPLSLIGADVSGVILAQSTRATDGVGIHGVISSDSGAALFGDSSATSGTGIGVEGNNASPFGTGVAGYNFALTGAATAVSGQTAAPNGLAIIGYSNATSGMNAGMLGSTASPAGYGVWGRSFAGGDLIAGTGVRGDSGGGTGVLGTSYAQASASAVAGVVGKNSGNGYGVYGEQLVGPGGAGVYGNGANAGVWGNANTGTGVLGATLTGTGVVGQSWSNGTGVSGKSSNIGVFGGGAAGLGATYGVYGQGASGVYGTGTNGVYGSGTNGVYGNGVNYGVFGTGVTGLRGESTSTSGIGVVGYDTATTGLTRGVYGESDSPNGHAVEGYSGPGVGIYGASTSGFAGYFAGKVSMDSAQVWGDFDHEGNVASFQHQVWIYGTLSKPAGSFKIDDPIDPSNKYLYHSFVESPDMKNLYDGVATLDARGESWVELPAYFEALNRDFRYQLTAIGRPAPSLYIADEIVGNRFRIAGGNPGQRVSWQATGTRHDAYADANRIPNEVDKPADERGRYLYPELFGQPASTAIRPANAGVKARHEPAQIPVLSPPPEGVTAPATRP